MARVAQSPHDSWTWIYLRPNAKLTSGGNSNRRQDLVGA